MDQQQQQQVGPKGVKYGNLNKFKIEEKRYKNYKIKNHKTDLSMLIDFNNQETFKNNPNIKCEEIQGYQTYLFNWPQGVIVVKNFLSLEEQIQLAKDCLNKYIKHRTNLFIYENEPQDFSKFIVNDYNRYFFNTKIRWSNVGQQYDWNNRQYPEQKTQVPYDIHKFAERANDLLKLQEKYQSESVIINYYGSDDYMTGHLDDAELDQDSPIISFSMGLSCVFLIGGPDKNEEPVAIKLESGDLTIMSVYSRRCYHGVPRVFQKEFKYWDKRTCSEEIKKRLEENDLPQEFQNEDFHVFNYLNEHRINMNIRQVYKQ